MNSESPAIGSPPISHFQDEEPISYTKPIDTETDAQTEIKKENGIENEDATSLPCANLETRRRKRESGSGTKLSIRRMSVFNSPEESIKEQAVGDGAFSEEKSSATTQVLPIRAGAKRKLGSRDDESKSASDFTFSRKTTSTASESTEESSAKEEEGGKKGRETLKTISRRGDGGRNACATVIAPPKLSERKALGEKSINTDPVVSPKKSSNAKKAGTTVQEEKEALKKPVKAAVEDTTKPTTRTIRDRRSRAAVAAVGVGDECITLPLPASLNHAAQPPETASISPPPESYTKGDANADTNTEPEPALPPKTPALALQDILSAPSTQSSTQHPPTGRDTPPPSLGDSNARPGRRARTQVNYAEPSLTAKMRRPGKELLDAVGRDGRVMGGMIVRKDGWGVEIKNEDGVGGSVWKGLNSSGLPSTGALRTQGKEKEEPCSPLTKKASSSNDAEALNVMRVSTEHQAEPILPSAASQAIAALIKDSKTSAAAAAARRRSSATLRTTSDAAAGEEMLDEKNKRGSSIYDFTSSSPPRSTSTATVGKSKSRPNSRSSDRESEDLGGGSKTGRTSSSTTSASSRRHSSVPSLNAGKLGSGTGRFSSASGNGVGVGIGAGHKRTVSGNGTTVRDAPASGEDAEVGKTTDLRASRRRSMML